MTITKSTRTICLWLSFPFVLTASVWAQQNGMAQPPAAETPTPAEAPPAAPPVSPSPPRAPTPSPPPPPRAPTAPPAASTPGPATIKMTNDEVLLNFQAADIQAVVKAVSQMTGRNFLLDPRVKGQITIISAKPVSRASAYQVFLSALKAQGFTAVEGPGELIKIVPAGDAKQSAGVSTKDSPRGGEQITTHVVVMQHVSAGQMVPLLRPLMAPTSQLSAYESANALIITDYADNIRRMLRIIDKIDQPVSTDVTVVPLTHASALDLADLISRLAGPGTPIAQPGQPAAQGAGGDRYTIIPDLRTNSLLIRTDNPGRLNQLRSLITKLDVPATTGGTTRVIYLRNAEATKIAEVLRGLLAGEARTQTASAVPAVAGAPSRAPVAAKAEASLIQADEATNALIINASDAVYNNLRAVIEKLDVRRAQVFVEALIAEITIDKASELGFQWFDAGRAGSGAVAGVQSFPSTTVPGGLIGAVADPKTLVGAAGFSLAFLGPKITLPDGSQVRTLGALARALEKDSLANILSTPNLMTLDNAEAKIVVGQNVPFITGSFASTAGTTSGAVNPFQTIERKDVGITLKIKPQISEGGGVKLDIFQEISTVSNSAKALSASDLITNKRSVETKVLVDDGNTIVLGGLIEDTTDERRQQVPFLGRIPLLGALFRYRENTRKKTNLMVFLRPTIIRTVEDGFHMTTDRYSHIRAQTRQNDPERNKILDRFEPKEQEPAPKRPAENKPADPPAVSDGRPFP